ncbi:MAG TPA: cysteine peptidase family C39 domain-containing protein, partial [Bacteroidales bacterium]|nr:cysteine peptidase family C39 domain-containing protein [Bacteroidales bacterium]
MHGSRFKTYRQYDAMDCGPTCLRMVAHYYGRIYTMETLRDRSGINREGASLLNISEAAESIGLRTVGAKLTWKQLQQQAPLPCIVYWKQVHFMVVYRIKKDKVWLADPAKGRVTLSKVDFLQHWLNAKTNGEHTGIALLLHTTPKFYELEDEESGQMNFSLLVRYVMPHKNLLFQLALGLAAGSILQLIFPFLTQAIVDIGINTHDLNFIYIILAAQLMLFGGRTGVEFIRSWILLHISA